MKIDDKSNQGLCPFCLVIVDRPVSGKAAACSCNKGNFNFHVAHILLQEALFQGTSEVVREIVDALPGIFAAKRFGMEFNKAELLNHIKIVDIEENPFLFGSIASKGIEIVKDLIAEKRKEIKERHGVEIDPVDAAAMITFTHLTRDCRDDLTSNIRVQDLNDLKKNEEEEFVLSDIAFGPGNEISIESESCIITGSPDIGIRFEKKDQGMWAYIKSERSVVVVIYRSFDYPPNSGIYIIH